MVRELPPLEVDVIACEDEAAEGGAAACHGSSGRTTRGTEAIGTQYYRLSPQSASTVPAETPLDARLPSPPGPVKLVFNDWSAALSPHGATVTSPIGGLGDGAGTGGSRSTVASRSELAQQMYSPTSLEASYAGLGGDSQRHRLLTAAYTPFSRVVSQQQQQQQHQQHQQHHHHYLPSAAGLGADLLATASAARAAPRWQGIISDTLGVPVVDEWAAQNESTSKPISSRLATPSPSRPCSPSSHIGGAPASSLSVGKRGNDVLATEFAGAKPGGALHHELPGIGLGLCKPLSTAETGGLNSGSGGPQAPQSPTEPYSHPPDSAWASAHSPSVNKPGGALDCELQGVGAGFGRPAAVTEVGGSKPGPSFQSPTDPSSRSSNACGASARLPPVGNPCGALDYESCGIGQGLGRPASVTESGGAKPKFGWSTAVEEGALIQRPGSAVPQRLESESGTPAAVALASSEARTAPRRGRRHSPGPQEVARRGEEESRASATSAAEARPFQAPCERDPPAKSSGEVCSTWAPHTGTARACGVFLDALPGNRADPHGSHVQQGIHGETRDAPVASARGEEGTADEQAGAKRFLTSHFSGCLGENSMQLRGCDAGSAAAANSSRGSGSANVGLAVGMSVKADGTGGIAPDEYSELRALNAILEARNADLTARNAELECRLLASEEDRRTCLSRVALEVARLQDRVRGADEENRARRAELEQQLAQARDQRTALEERCRALEGDCDGLHSFARLERPITEDSATEPFPRSSVSNTLASAGLRSSPRRLCDDQRPISSAAGENGNQSTAHAVSAINKVTGADASPSPAAEADRAVAARRLAVAAVARAKGFFGGLSVGEPAGSPSSPFPLTAADVSVHQAGAEPPSALHQSERRAVSVLDSMAPAPRDDVLSPRGRLSPQYLTAQQAWGRLGKCRDKGFSGSASHYPHGGSLGCAKDEFGFSSTDGRLAATGSAMLGGDAATVSTTDGGSSNGSNLFLAPGATNAAGRAAWSTTAMRSGSLGAIGRASVAEPAAPPGSTRACSSTAAGRPCFSYNLHGGRTLGRSGSTGCIDGLLGRRGEGATPWLSAVTDLSNTSAGLRGCADGVSVVSTAGSPLRAPGDALGPLHGYATSVSFPSVPADAVGGAHSRYGSALDGAGYSSTATAPYSIAPCCWAAGHAVGLGESPRERPPGSPMGRPLISPCRGRSYCRGFSEHSWSPDRSSGVGVSVDNGRASPHSPASRYRLRRFCESLPRRRNQYESALLTHSGSSFLP